MESLFFLLPIAYRQDLGRMLGISWAFVRDPSGQLQQWSIKSCGRSFTVYIGQETMTYVKLGLSVALDDQSCSAMVLETPPIGCETYGNSYLLPAEGTQLFKIRLPTEAGNGGKDQEEEKSHNEGELPRTTLLVIQRGNVNTNTEYLTITGWGDGAQRYVTMCQQQSIKEKGYTIWVPETSVARNKGRGPWQEYNTKPREDWASFTAPGGVKETVLKCLDRWDSPKDRQESKGNGNMDCRQAGYYDCMLDL